MNAVLMMVLVLIVALGGKKAVIIYVEVGGPFINILANMIKNTAPETAAECSKKSCISGVNEMNKR